MYHQSVRKLAIIVALGVVCVDCGGLDGIRGTVVAIEENHSQYLVRDARGREWRIWTNAHTRKDPVERGDEVRVFATKDGHAAYIQKLGGGGGGTGLDGLAPR